MRGVWIEMAAMSRPPIPEKSLPMRGVWIEIALKGVNKTARDVTPHAGSVD